MNINPTNNYQQSFKALNIENLSVAHRSYIHKYELDKLKELGTRFDVKLTSTYSGIKGYEAIDIGIKPLKENLSFFKKFFQPIGKSSYLIDENSSILEYVNEAVADLCKKLESHK